MAHKNEQAKKNSKTKDSSKELASENDVSKWGSNEQLSTKTIQFLTKEGFTSMDLLYQLTPQMVKDSFQVPRLLPLAQCLALQKAVTKFQPVIQIDECVRVWGESEGLTAETLTELARQGFDSVSKLRLLTPDIIMEILIKQGKLQLAEGLLLGKALNSLPKDTRKTKADIERSQHVRKSNDEPRPHSSPALMANAQSITNSLDRAKELYARKKGNVLRLLLVGKSGSGISSTGNSILGEKKFMTSLSSELTTSQCETIYSTRNGFTIEVIDTPGLAHPKLSNEFIAQEILNYTSQAQSASLTIIIVIRYGNYTDEDTKVYAALRKTIQAENYKDVILAFTYCDELERKNDTVSNYVKRWPELQKIFKAYRGRYIKVNNTGEIMTARSDMILSEIFKYLNETHQS